MPAVGEHLMGDVSFFQREYSANIRYQIPVIE
jgi:hypothetical protein